MSPVNGVDAEQLMSISQALKETYPKVWRDWREILTSIDTANDDDIREAFIIMRTVFDGYLNSISFQTDRKKRSSPFLALEDICRSDLN